ncbi:hypothetical protein [Paracoccus aestuariivivens]|uniref:hypothetical protein n=1 Tax=Paracoccus aestuariivivens TaxID=1820333 RepID=UPI0012BAA714|nr:hypothetical protein [Paracoccus aestuariivivens]
MKLDFSANLLKGSGKGASVSRNCLKAVIGHLFCLEKEIGVLLSGKMHRLKQLEGVNARLK